MAQVTVELRHLLNNTPFELFDFTYQFDDPIFKAKLEQDVIDFYWNYEIGQETPLEFKRRFKAKWLRIIDYYNKLYNTTLLVYNPLTNYSMAEAFEQLSSSTGSNHNVADTTLNSHTFDDLSTKTSDYPQQPIAGGDYLKGEDNSLNDSTTDSEGNVTTHTNTEGTTNNNYTKTIEGLTGITYQDLIIKERENLLKIPRMVIEELKGCFILIY